ncbi:MAG: branched-chain amino acid ABC transporter permease [Candidatus Eisenbacteria bacterium]|nr:branched-chain amino acid ABC transporter permease [Candidatus Eisenbacteria bacterium]
MLFGADRLLAAALNPYVARILILSGINIVLAVSLNLINGFTGQFSLGHAGFMAIGGYAAAWFSLVVGPSFGPSLQVVSFLVALALGSGLAALAGLLIGIPTLRLRGDYLAIATLGFGEIIRVVILNLEFLGGARGLTGIPPRTTFFWVYLAVVACVVFHANLVRSRHGRALLAVRDDEVAAESLGVPTTRYKIQAFVIGAAWAGLAGGLFGHYLMYLHTNSFTFMKSIEVVIMVVLGGMGSITGSILAAIVLTVLPEALREFREYRMVLYSLLLIVLMIARPQGMFGTRELPRVWQQLRERVQRRGA